MPEVDFIVVVDGFLWFWSALAVSAGHYSWKNLT